LALLPLSLSAQEVSGSVQSVSPKKQNDEAAEYASKEIERRKVLLDKANTLINEADDLRTQSQWEPALAKYREIIALFPVPSHSVAPALNRAYDGAAIALLELADVDAKEGRLDAARAKADEARSFAPNDPKLNESRAKLYAQMGIRLDGEGNMRVNLSDPSNTPTHLKNVSDVVRLLGEAELLREAGRFDEAHNTFQKVLTLDPYNKAARQGIERVVKEKNRWATKASDAAREIALNEVNSKWEMPVSREAASSVDASMQTVISRKERTAVDAERILKNLVVPAVNFDGSSIQDVVSFLQQKTRAAGPDTAVNFVVRLQGAKTSDVALSLQNVPVYEVLRYATQLSNTKFRIDEKGIVNVVPVTSDTDTQVTKTYNVSSDFFVVEKADEPAAGGSRRGRSSANTPAQVADGINAKDALIAKGVAFPAGSSASYNPAKGVLTVRNTLTNLELLDSMVGATTSPADQVQVEIEAKFVDISSTHLEELSSAMNVVRNNDFGRRNGLSRNVAYTRASGDMSANYMDGFNNLDGLRSNDKLRRNSVDALLAQNGSGGGTGFVTPNNLNFNLSVLNLDMDVMIRALSQLKGVDLLFAPKVVAQSGQLAKISVNREFRYPTEFKEPQVPTGATASGGSTTVTGSAVSAPAPAVVPALPSAFSDPKESQIGVTLEVRPQVGADNATVDLDIRDLKVRDFEGFINYGPPIEFSSPDDPDARLRLADNVINQPIFNDRSITTSVQVMDGNTVVIGGLIREDVEKIDDKVPVIGDIPLLGRLFRSKVEQATKRNLLVFITPKLVTPSGELVNPAAAATPYAKK
jgi:general secretion pathway protein D